MPVKGFLNLEQKEGLQTLVRSNDCQRIREHALILLLQNDSKTYEEIANFIGCGYRTVAHWCEVCRDEGLIPTDFARTWRRATT